MAFCLVKTKDPKSFLEHTTNSLRRHQCINYQNQKCVNNLNIEFVGSSSDSNEMKYPQISFGSW